MEVFSKTRFVSSPARKCVQMTRNRSRFHMSSDFLQKIMKSVRATRSTRRKFECKLFHGMCSKLKSNFRINWFVYEFAMSSKSALCGHKLWFCLHLWDFSCVGSKVQIIVIVNVFAFVNSMRLYCSLCQRPTPQWFVPSWTHSPKMNSCVTPLTARCDCSLCVFRLRSLWLRLLCDFD